MIYDTDKDTELLKAQSCLPANNQMFSIVTGTEQVLKYLLNELISTQNGEDFHSDI